MRRAPRGLVAVWLPRTVDACNTSAPAVLPALAAAAPHQRAWTPPSTRRASTGVSPEFGRAYTERKLLG